MDVSGYHHSDSITVAAPPADVYAIVSDVTRIGELSPMCRSADWDDPTRAGTTGAWFTGHNAIGDITWDTHCQVTVAEPDREFTFVNHGQAGDAELVRWGFMLEPVGETTMVTEAWQVLPAYPDMVLAGDPNADVAARIDGMAQLARDGIAETLVNLKRTAEA
jgi:carbon monoxide dehydrogenase subunit G